MTNVVVLPFQEHADRHHYWQAHTQAPSPVGELGPMYTIHQQAIRHALSQWESPVSAPWVGMFGVEAETDGPNKLPVAFSWEHHDNCSQEYFLGTFTRMDHTTPPVGMDSRALLDQIWADLPQQPAVVDSRVTEFLYPVRGYLMDLYRQGFTTGVVLAAGDIYRLALFEPGDDVELPGFRFDASLDLSCLFECHKVCFEG